MLHNVATVSAGRTHIPIAADAADSLRATLQAMGGHVTVTGAASNLARWFACQPPLVVDAILRAGAGAQVTNTAELLRLVRFDLRTSGS